MELNKRKKKKVCVWKHDDWDETDSFETSCDQEFLLTEGGLKDNQIKYCPFCGKTIEEL